MSNEEKKSMTPQLRNRIVGSVILLIAAIVILPSIIGTGKVSLKDDFKTVPPKPEFEVVQNDREFPQTAFEQNMPAKTPIVDEKPLDGAPQTVKQVQEQQGREQDSTASVVQTAPKTIETDTLTVSTMSKPQDFLTPEQMAAQQREKKQQRDMQEQRKKQQQADEQELVLHNSGNKNSSAKASNITKPSPFATQAWVIQLGSFGNKANANAIEKKLNDAGFTTFSRQIQSTNGPLTKVYVGPELDKKVLQRSLARVNQVANVKGLVTSFTIRR